VQAGVLGLRANVIVRRFPPSNYGSIQAGRRKSGWKSHGKADMVEIAEAGNSIHWAYVSLRT